MRGAAERHSRDDADHAPVEHPERSGPETLHDILTRPHVNSSDFSKVGFKVVLSFVNDSKAARLGSGALQRRSKRLNHRTVAAVLEEAAGVFGTESRDRSAHRFEKSFSATRLGFTHQAFDLAECLLDGVEVR